jgi:hypothetical protein
VTVEGGGDRPGGLVRETAVEDAVEIAVLLDLLEILTQGRGETALHDLRMQL